MPFILPLLHVAKLAIIGAATGYVVYQNKESIEEFVDDVYYACQAFQERRRNKQINTGMVHEAARSGTYESDNHNDTDNNNHDDDNEVDDDDLYHVPPKRGNTGGSEWSSAVTDTHDGQTTGFYTKNNVDIRFQKRGTLNKSMGTKKKVAYAESTDDYTTDTDFSSTESSGEETPTSL